MRLKNRRRKPRGYGTRQGETNTYFANKIHSTRRYSYIMHLILLLSLSLSIYLSLPLPISLYYKYKHISETLTTVNEEIISLRDRLATLESEAAALSSEAATHDASIIKVRSTFTRRTARLDKKTGAANEARNEWDVEKESLANLQEAHTFASETHTRELEERAKAAAKAELEAKAAEIATEVTRKEVVVVIDSPKDGHAVESNGPDESDNGEDGVAACEAMVEEADLAVATVRGTIDTLRAEADKIDACLPVLEENKKSAASSRNFKAAGKASREIKELSSRRERIEEELEDEALERLEGAASELERAAQALQSAKSLSREKDGEEGKRIMKNLAQKIGRMRCAKDELLDVSPLEREDKYELERDEYTVVAITLRLLDGEIDALKIEGETLGSKFGGWDDILHKATSDLVKNISLDEADSEDLMEDGLNGDTDNTGDNDDNDDGSDSVSGVIDTDHHEQECYETKLQTFRELIPVITQAEMDLNDAIEEEDYDKAAELDGMVENLKEQRDMLCLTDADIVLASKKSYSLGIVQDANDISDTKSNASDTDSKKKEIIDIKNNNDNDNNQEEEKVTPDDHEEDELGEVEEVNDAKSNVENTEHSENVKDE